MTRLLVLLVMLSCQGMHAQEHPYLSQFTLTEGLGSVRVDWTMIAGNTCEGIDIHRSLDGLDFTTVGAIPGICGDVNAPVVFAWTDEQPPELTTVYYRLRLGLNGFSSVQAIELQELVSRKEWIFPVPASDRCTLLLRVPAMADVQLQLFAADGRLVQDRAGLRGGRQELDLVGLSSGTYMYQARANGEVFSGRLIVAR